MNKYLKYSLWSLLYLFLTGALVGYFIAASSLRENGKKGEVCKSIRVTLLDSALNRFVTKQEVIDIMQNSNRKSLIGMRIDSLKLAQLENTLNNRSAIKKSDISIRRDGELRVDILQRVPVVRVEMNGGGYYIDDTGYIFPLIENSSTYIPIVTGELPIDITKDHRLVGKDSINWVKKIMDLGIFLKDNPFWNAQIEQIYFAKPNCVEMFTRIGDQKIIFGDLKYIEEKFEKLYAFYLNATPSLGWEKYASIDLSFRNQIVCKKNK